MTQPSDPPENHSVPLCVDLDGTLIKTDLTWEHLVRLLQRNPVWLFAVLVWWMRGRAYMKWQLARRVSVDPATLPYHQAFLSFLREQKSAGRKLVLATASDGGMAMPVADYLGLFDEVVASDGKTNLRSGHKLKLLTKKFGERGFDYAGNARADLAVWGGAREIIVVNAAWWLDKQMQRRPTPSGSLGESDGGILQNEGFGWRIIRMAVELKVPSVGESVTEVEIGPWLKREGDAVNKDDNVVTLESEKATVELPSPVSGTLGKIVKRTGEKAAVGDVIALIEPSGKPKEEAKSAQAKNRPSRREPVAASDHVRSSTRSQSARRRSRQFRRRGREARQDVKKKWCP